jgi:hypothetical protein
LFDRFSEAEEGVENVAGRRLVHGGRVAAVRGGDVSAL